MIAKVKEHRLRKIHLDNLKKIERHKHHPLIHHIHKKYGISKKTLFYVKEYGPKSNVSHTIIRESIKILLFASIVSALGGLALVAAALGLALLALLLLAGVGHCWIESCVGKIQDGPTFGHAICTVQTVTLA